MIKNSARALLVPALLLVGSAQAQQAQAPPSRYPVMDMVAQKIIDKSFIDKVAAPIANKMFECGMIP